MGLQVMLMSLAEQTSCQVGETCGNMLLQKFSGDTSKNEVDLKDDDDSDETLSRDSDQLGDSMFQPKDGGAIKEDMEEAEKGKKEKKRRRRTRRQNKDKKDGGAIKEDMEEAEKDGGAIKEDMEEAEKGKKEKKRRRGTRRQKKDKKDGG